jgi:hypothetical protein
MTTTIDRTWYPVPPGHAICPLCNGTGIGKELTDGDKKYSWNKGRTHFQCMNCGGQTMSSRSEGWTKIDPATGKGCEHKFTGRTAGNCYNIYTCTKCTYHYDIDSGD